MQHLAPAVLILALAPGCGDGGDGLPREGIAGEVKLDGQPLARGTIRFLPAGPPGPGGAPISSGAVIEGGRFEIARAQGPTPGKYTVSISSSAGGATHAAPGPAPGRSKEAISDSIEDPNRCISHVSSAQSCPS